MARLIRAFVPGACVALLALAMLAPASLAASPRALLLGPTAYPDTFPITAQTTLVVPAPGVLANDKPGLLGILGLRALLVSPPVYGTLTTGLSSNGGFTYQPPGGFSGVDTFTYRAVDALGQSSPATVSIMVAAPTATPTPRPTPTPTPTPTPRPTPTPTPRPTLPLPTLPPTLPLPTLPLPTPSLALPTPTLPVPATPAPTPSLPSLPGTSPVPSVAPPPPSGVLRTPAPSESPGPSVGLVVAGTSGGGPGDPGGPIAGVGGPTSGGTDLVPTIPGVGPGADSISVGSIGDGGFGIEWIVPTVLVTLPGFLLIIVGLAQFFGGFFWLPIARRWLRGDGRRAAPPVIGSMT